VVSDWAKTEVVKARKNSRNKKLRYIDIVFEAELP
jgi:hypothetical protein